ncbi:MAG: hypothetical protein K2I72_01120, partial [Bacilli bacterium]|nr:hypothetical protein [Bacilli bacterium]
MNCVTIGTILLSYLYVIFKSKKAMHMLQQNLYNMNHRYLKWIVKNLGSVFVSIDILSVICFALSLWFKQEVWLYVSCVIYVGGIFLVHNKA